jgi:hypothetical protein
VPCRWAGGGSVPDPAKDVAEDVRDAPRGHPFEPARDRGVDVSGQAVALSRSSPPAQTGCGTPSRRAGARPLRG